MTVVLHEVGLARLEGEGDRREAVSAGTGGMCQGRHAGKTLF